MSAGHFYQNELFRKTTREDEQKYCPNGYIKRASKPARREEDCPFDCSSQEQCNIRANKELKKWIFQ